MSWPYVPYAIALAATTGLAAGVTILAWRRRSVHGGKALVLVMAAVTLWSYAACMQTLATNTEGKVFWTRIGALGLASLPTLWLVFILRFTAQDRWLARPLLLVLWIIPAVTGVLALSSAWHPLLWPNLGPISEDPHAYLIYSRGPWWWVQMIQGYLLVLCGTMVLVRFVALSSRLVPRQAVGLLAAACLPPLGNLLYAFGWSPNHVDLTPILFTWSGLMMAWNLPRWRLYELVPIARDMVVDRMADGVVLLDARGQLIDCNPAAEKLLRFERNGAMGRPAVEVLARWPVLAQSLAGNESGRGEERRQDAGPESWLEHRVSPMRDSRGALTGTLLVVQDITLRKQAEAQGYAAVDQLRNSWSQLAMLIDGVPALIAYVDADERFVHVNQGYADWYGHPRDWYVGKRISELLDEQTYGRSAPYYRAALGGKTVAFETQDRDFHGRARTVSVMLVPHFGDQDTVKGFFALTQDVTDQRRAREELRQAVEAAERANRAKSFFLANMSHELRTPLNSILGFAQLLADDPRIDEDQLESLNTIVRSGEHLLALINDVLELSKIEAGRMVLDVARFDLHSLLDELEELFYRRTAAKGLAWRMECASGVPQHIEGDERRLRQVLINLIGNAVKFTQVGGVTLRARSVTSHALATGVGPTTTAGRGPAGNGHAGANPGASWVLFEVEDTGPGMQPAEITMAFEAFSQTTSGRESREGTGLGLTISRQFVRLMGGDISVDSQPGRGSIFSFAIPCPEVPPPPPLDIQRLAASRVIGLAPGQPSYRLLVAEDHVDSRRLLVRLLTPLGFEVREATNGQETLECWESWRPHLIWLDMRMPLFDGHQVVRSIKSTSQGRNTVVVALTASAFEEERTRMLAEGCDDVLCKPFRREQIFDALRRHLGVRFVSANDGPLPGPVVTRGGA